jgi:hypothetical protein
MVVPSASAKASTSVNWVSGDIVAQRERRGTQLSQFALSVEWAGTAQPNRAGQQSFR